ncbi:MAG: CapA family protein [Candidatus Njordarchaeum guaymaensis]
MNGIDNDISQTKTASRRWFSTPYNFREKLAWIKNNLFGPSKKYKELTEFIPKSLELNPISTQVKLGFIGDIMPMKRKILQFDESLREFINDVDYLVGNFEGIITNSKKRVFMAQIHSEQILLDLKKLFPPEKTILACANNHSADFGFQEFKKSYQLLKDHGFLIIGTKDEPKILLKDSVNLANITYWSNHPCSFLADFENVDKYFDPNAKFNILYQHWGYELQLYPNPAQIKLGKKLLEKWDMIVGHHSHCPQPIARYGNKIIAYSLGDFCIGKNLRKYSYGMIVKAEIGPDNKGIWRVGKIEWRFTKIEHINRHISEVRIVNQCKFFDLDF